MNKLFKILFIGIIVLQSCSQDYTLDVPAFGEDNPSGMVMVSEFAKKSINGIYMAEGAENNKFGDTVIVKWNGDKLSVYTRKNAAYMIFQGGSLDNSYYFKGYWRLSRSSETGLAKIEILENDGAISLLGEIEPNSLQLRMEFGNEDKLTSSLILKKVKDLKDESFIIIAHRGGGRNSDKLPASENSLDIIPYAEILGANGIEIDVRLTKDKIPILYHDETFNKRLVKTEFLIGDVDNFLYYQIRNFCKLIHGEQIPTLEEALDFVVNKTTLKYVWLDIKSPETLDIIIPMQIKYMREAKNIGRDLIILCGLATDEIYERYISKPKELNAPALCELGPEETIESNSAVWAPRWTLGMLDAEVQNLKSKGKKSVVWTLDDPAFIYKYVNESSFDGILTNYPSLVAYEYYMKD